MSKHPLGSALVTGGAQRIGRAIVLELANRGLAVAIHYNRSKDAAESLAGEIAAAGGRAVAVHADLADENQTAALVSEAALSVGPLSVLVNNASVFEDDSPQTASRESWNAHMQVNLRAPFMLSQDFVKQASADCRCNVINIIDQRVWNLTSYFTTYTLSKAALWTMTQTLALALAPGFRVNAIGPGPTLASVRQTDEAFRRQWTSTPLSRRVEPKEIGETVGFILDAPSLTGQMIALDGGQHLGWRQPTARDEE